MTVLAFHGIYKNIKQNDVFIRLLLLFLYENSLVLIKAEDEFVNVLSLRTPLSYAINRLGQDTISLKWLIHKDGRCQRQIADPLLVISQVIIVYCWQCDAWPH